MCVCVCMCVREGGRENREIEGGRERERESVSNKTGCVCRGEGRYVIILAGTRIGSFSAIYFNC